MNTAILVVAVLVCLVFIACYAIDNIVFEDIEIEYAAVTDDKEDVVE